MSFFDDLAPGNVKDISGEEKRIMTLLEDYYTASFSLSKERQDELFPQLLAQIGIDPQALHRDEIDALKNIFQQTSDRLSGALAGKDDFSPGLTRDLAKQRELSTEELTRQLGSNYLKSTAGGQGLARIGESEAITLDTARRGEINSGTQNLLGLGSQIGNLTASGADIANQKYNQLFQLFASQDPTQAATGLAYILQQYKDQRLLEEQAAQARKAYKSQMINEVIQTSMGGGAQLIGSIFGGGGGSSGGSSFMSSYGGSTPAATGAAAAGGVSGVGSIGAGAAGSIGAGAAGGSSMGKGLALMLA